jgi:hypothetical protein
LPSAASRRLEPRLHVPPPYRPRRRRDPSQPSLTQFVVLSILLHALFILLFGSPSGGSSQGRAMWGSLDVTIRGPLLDSGVGLGTERAQPLQLPGTQMLEKRERKRETPPPPTPAPPEARSAPPDLEASRVADMPSPAPLAPIVPASAPPVDLAPAPRIDPAREEARVIPVPAIEWTPVAESEAAPGIDAPLVDAPRVDAPPRRVRAPVVPAPMLPEGGSSAAAPRLAPSVQIAPLPAQPRRVVPIETPAIAAQPLPASPAAAPALAPPVQVDAVAPPAPPRVVPVETPAIATQPLPASPVATPSLAPPVEVKAALPAAPPRVVPVETPAIATQPAPAAAAASPALAPPVEVNAVTPRAAAPARDSPIFNNRRAPASDAPFPGTGIDLEAAKARAREIAREGTGNRALLPFPMPPAPERKTKEQIAIEKAWKPDCKDAYKGLGLLAVVPLIANEFGEGSCRW